MNIKPGDMVMLVCGCCPDVRRHIGWTTTVRALDNIEAKRMTPCPTCGYRESTLYARMDYSPRCPDYRPDSVCPVFWLIKIDPPGVTTEKRETVEA